jgi:uncharacterized protein YneF (UPF0154 family)
MTIPNSLVLGLVGLATGFFVGYRYYEGHIADVAMHKAIKEMMDEMVRSAGDQTAQDIHVIESFGPDASGDAVRLLAGRIADYYQHHANNGGTDQERTLRAAIDQLARTNPVVADEIHTRFPSFQ